MSKQFPKNAKRNFTAFAALLLLVIAISITKGEGVKLELPLDTLNVESGAFEHDGFMPSKYTGRGEDISPELTIHDISPDAKSIAIIMDDNDIPVMGIMNHWVIWNIPVQSVIPENIPYGAVVDSLGGAIQGVGYGKHRYRGPKPPSFMKNAHRYQFHVYVLDCIFEIDSNSGKKELLKSMDGHILQYGSLIGKYRNQ